MSDKEICQWIHDRLVGMLGENKNVDLGENKNVDYMIRFRKAIDRIPNDDNTVTRLVEAAKRILWERENSVNYATTTDQLRDALAAFPAKETP